MTTPQAGNGFNLGNATGYVDINTSRAVSNLQGLRGQMQSFFDSTQRMGQQISSFGQSFTLAMAPVSLAMGAGIQAAGNFQDAMAEIAARTGLTGEALDEIRNKALAMGADTSFSSQQAANAFLQLLSSGSSAAEAMQQIEAVLRGAEASGSDLAFTADALTDIMAAMGLEASQSAEVMDSLIDATGSSSATFTDLAQGFANIGPIARNMNMSVNDVAATLAVFSENGIKGAEAGTQLRSMLNNMTRNTADVQGTWQELGISLYDTEGQMRGLNDIIGDLNHAMDGMTDEDRNRIITTLAGTYGQLGLSALLATGGIEDMQEKMETQTHFTEIAAERMRTFNGLMTSLKGSIEALLITAFTPFIEAMMPAIEQQIAIVNGMTEWIAANQAIVQPILRVLKIMTLLGPALFLIGKALPIIVGGFGLLLSPIGLLIGASAALSAAWVTNFGGIQDKVMNFVASVQRGFRILRTNLQAGNTKLGAASNAWLVFATSMGMSWEQAESIANRVQNVFAGMNAVFNSAKQTVTKAIAVIRASFSFLKGDISSMSDGMSQLMLAGFDGAESGKILGKFNSVIKPIRNIFLGIVETVMRVRNAVMPLFRELSIFFGNLFGNVDVGQLAQVGGFLLKLTNPLGQIQLLLQGLGVEMPGLVSMFESAMRVLTSFFQNLNMGIGVVDALKIALGNPQWLDNVIAGFVSISNFITGRVLPALRQLGDWFVSSALPGIVTFVTGTVVPAIQNFVGILAGAWSKIQPNLGPIASWLATFAGQVFTIFTQVAKLLIDIGMVVVPIVAQALTGFLLPALSTAIEWLQGLWTFVAPYIQQLVVWFQRNMPYISEAINLFLTTAWRALRDALTSIWNFVAPIFQSIVDWFTTGGLSDIATAIGNFLIGTWDVLTGALSAIWDLVSAPFQNISNWFTTGGLQAVARAIGGFLANTWNGFKNAISGIWNFVSGGIDAFVNGISAAINRIIGFIRDAKQVWDNFRNSMRNAANDARTDIQNMQNAIQQGGVGGAVNQGVQNIQSFWGSLTGALQNRDSGGTGTAGTPVVIGKRAQPEIFVPQTNGTFIPNIDQLLQGAGGGMNFNGATFNINASTYEEGRAAARGLLDELDDVLKVTGTTI